MKELGIDKAGGSLPERTDCGIKQLDLALDQLAVAEPKFKKRILDASSACIGFDDHVTVEESELLRIIADALECPMPPLVITKLHR